MRGGYTFPFFSVQGNKTYTHSFFRTMRQQRRYLAYKRASRTKVVWSLLLLLLPEYTLPLCLKRWDDDDGAAHCCAMCYPDRERVLFYGNEQQQEQQSHAVLCTDAYHVERAERRRAAAALIIIISPVFCFAHPVHDCCYFRGAISAAFPWPITRNPWAQRVSHTQIGSWENGKKLGKSRSPERSLTD